MTSAYAEAVNYVTVKCPGCGDTRRVTDRQYRRAKADGSDFKCQICRNMNKQVEVTEAHRRYWTDRYPMEWIIETAELIWGPVH